ncbi:hypothetical protein D3C77_338720 [compost metagenome]
MARLVLSDLDPQHLAWLVPVVNHLTNVVVLIKQGCQSDGMLAHFINLLATDPVLDRPAHRRAHLQRLDVGADADEVLTQALFQTIHQHFTRLETLTDNHQLGVVRVLQLLVQRQVETNRALADIGAPAHDVRITLECRFKPVHRLASFLNRGILRQVEVDQNLWTIRRREELVLHETHAEHRQHKQQHRTDDGQPTIAHAPQQTVLERLADAPRLFIVRFHLGAENVHAKHWGEQYRHHPGHQQRRSNNREQGVGVLPRRTAIEADRHEARHRHQGTGEHRKGRRGIGERRRLLFTLTHLQARDHYLHRDHRIVHQQSQGNDQRTQGDPLHGDAAVLHEDEYHGQYQRN